MRRTRKKVTVVRRTLALASVLTLVLQPVIAGATLFTWNGGAGNWTTTTLWTPNGDPNSASDTVAIDGGKTGTASTVTLNASRTIGGVTIDVGDALHFNNATSLTLAGGSALTNNGLIQLNSAGNNTDFAFGAGITINGSGVLRMGDNGNNRIFGTAGTNVLTNSSNHTIAGSGQFGVDFLRLNNQGVIQADQTNLLNVDLAGGITENFNSGTMRATAGGILRLTGTALDNTGGTLQAQNGSEVQFNSSTVKGGTLTTSGTGLLRVINSSSFESVTINSNLTVNNGVVSTWVNTVTNNGTILLNSAGNNTDFAWSGNVTLNGTGTLTTSDNASNRFYASNGADRLTNNSTIQGSGQFGVNFGTLTNNGLIVANQTNMLNIDTASAATNNGTLRATSGAVLRITNSVITNNSGTIEAQNGSEVQFNGATINGGTLTTSGTGVLRAIGLSEFNGVTINSTYIQNNGVLTAFNTLTNNGSMLLNSAGNNTDMQFGTTTWKGSGTLTTSDNGSNRIYGTVGGNTLTNKLIIQGSGQLGANQGAIINEKQIIANQGNALIVDTSGDFNNFKTMKATNGAVLRLQNSNFKNKNKTTGAIGTFTADAGSEIQVTGSFLQKGLFNGAGTTRFTGSSTIKGLELNGSMIQNNGVDVLLQKKLKLTSGTYLLNSAGNNTDFRYDDLAELKAGGGKFVMSNNLSNRVFGSSGANTLIINAKIEGAGQLGTNQGAIVNNSTVTANVSNALILDTSGNFTNNSILRADGGTLRLQNSTFNQAAAAKIEALNSSEAQFTGATVNGGILHTDATGILRATGTSTFSGVTIDSTFIQNNGVDVTIAGTLTNNGSYTVNSAGNNTDFKWSGNQTLNGTGTFNLSNSGANRLFATNGSDILTIGANQTVQGSGQMGVDFGGFVNNGTVRANQSTALTINPSVNGFVNNGVVDIDATRTMNIVDGFSQSATGDLIIDGTLGATSITIGAGDVFGTGNTTGSLSNTGGNIRPGNSAGQLRIGDGSGTDDYTQGAGGALHIEIGGLAVGTQYDRFNVDDLATLAGTLNISLINAFIPNIGDSFTIMTFASRSGTFGTVNGLSINGTRHFGITYNATNVVLDVLAGPGAPPPGGKGGGQVPEPGTWAMLTAGVAGAALLLRKRRS